MVDFGARSDVPTISADESGQLLERYGPLAQAVRGLIDATIRTQADEATVREVTAQVQQLTERLRAGTLSESPGLRYVVDGRPLAWGNAVVGLRNPIAPPLVIQHGENGHCWADFHLGAAYEGPPSLVHGGVSALVLDHVLGEAASDGLTKPNYTGTITVKYLRGTPLGPLHAEASIYRRDGVKTYARGHISDADGVTVEADGVFITPSWARDTVD
ncbi:thioesterase [Mycolicibacter nonchromogenicus]|uniref:Thioesterase n=1 Tax=Mycolicibacter nonchromogenicus TaxID=1782 RepID=A0A1X1YXW3_MYCNO|nr:thioesterase [Mycolicibacter heraklionensis]ORW15932.1 thioesterase [Mycolicibacter nonchromogenicus]